MALENVFLIWLLGMYLSYMFVFGDSNLSGRKTLAATLLWPGVLAYVCIAGIKELIHDEVLHKGQRHE